MTTDDSTMRELPRDRAKALAPGSEHYMAYVGAPDQYDFMGATQFRLLTTLGLREHHAVLDFGCGSLRLGRLLMPYLAEGRYFGLDPNRWLIEDAIERELGTTIVELKRPTFLHRSDYRATAFETMFDFVVAQSIFSHMGSDVIGTCLDEFRKCLAEGGLILATFVYPHQLGGAKEFAGKGWVYPECVVYEPPSVIRMIEAAGLVGRPIPWFHPRQTWFAIAHAASDLPDPADDVHLSGAVLRDASLRASVGRAT